MKKKLITRVMVAAIMLLGVQTSANAQFGGLIKKAKKTAEKVTNTATQGTGVQQSATSPSAAEAQADYRKNHPAAMEKYNAEKAGGMDKYLELDKTVNGQIVWKYASMTNDQYTKNKNLNNACEAGRQLTYVLRYMKGNTEQFNGHAQSAYTLEMLNERIPGYIKVAVTGKDAISKADADALTAECARIKKEYLEFSGVREKTAEEKKSEANAEYVQNIVRQNYLLNDLTDKNRQAKAVANYKTKVNAKVKADLAPTKILGTYSTSPAWQTLPIFQMPELKEKYKSVQEMQFKTFYEKDGKYFVVKSAFRQSIDKGDEVHGAQPQKFYWPGLETPVEIPADKIQGKF